MHLLAITSVYPSEIPTQPPGTLTHPLTLAKSASSPQVQAPYSYVKRLKKDDVIDFTSETFQRFLADYPIKIQKPARYSPHQNRNIECSWRAFFSMVRCHLIVLKRLKNWWIYAVMALAYIRNGCYNRNTRKNLYENFTVSKPNLNKIHIFGPTSFRNVQSKTILDPPGEKGIFVGYDKQSTAYSIYFLVSKYVKRVR